MKARYFILLVLLSVSPAASLLGSQETESCAPKAGFAGFVDDYFDALYDWAPSQATAAGFHQYDSRLEDLSSEAFDRHIHKKELPFNDAGLPVARGPG